MKSRRRRRGDDTRARLQVRFHWCHSHIIRRSSGSVYVVCTGQQLYMKPTGFLVKCFMLTLLSLLGTFPLGFKARLGSLIHTWRMRTFYSFLKFTSGATPADLLAASMAAGQSFPHQCIYLQSNFFTQKYCTYVFLRRATTPKVCVVTYYFAFFSQKLHENERI